MRKFNKYEKSVLTLLSKKSKNVYYPISLNSLFEESTMVNRAVFLDSKNQQITFACNDDDMSSIYMEFLNFLTLIEYLSSNGYVSLIQNNYNVRSYWFLSFNLMKVDEESEYLSPLKPNKKKWNRDSYIPNKLMTINGDYLPKAFETFGKEIIVSAEIIQIVKDKFRTSEMKLLRFSVIQTYLSFFALFVALTTLFLSFWITYPSRTTDSKKSDLIIENDSNDLKDSILHDSVRVEK